MEDKVWKIKLIKQFQELPFLNKINGKENGRWKKSVQQQNEQRM